MKAEHEPITPDEWLIRCVIKVRVKGDPPVVSASAFEPRTSKKDPTKNEAGGISLFRRACVAAPADVLLAFKETMRSEYALVQIPVALIFALGLTVRPSRISQVPGHVVIPEINSDDFQKD